jgi:GNAT superfamily N-acetyltransferase
VGKLSAPVLLNASHVLSEFDCVYQDLNDWLKRRAMANQTANASKTYVVCDGINVVGYYALAPGGVDQKVVTGKLRRNMPNPIPVIVLGRLAVDQKREGAGVGKGLIKDAVLRASQVAEIIGGRAMLCHAIDENAKNFYLKHGFIESPLEPLTVMLSLTSS